MAYSILNNSARSSLYGLCYLLTVGELLIENFLPFGRRWVSKQKTGTRFSRQEVRCRGQADERDWKALLFAVSSYRLLVRGLARAGRPCSFLAGRGKVLVARGLAERRANASCSLGGFPAHGCFGIGDARKDVWQKQLLPDVPGWWRRYQEWVCGSGHALRPQPARQRRHGMKGKNWL